MKPTSSFDFYVVAELVAVLVANRSLPGGRGGAATCYAKSKGIEQMFSVWVKPVIENVEGANQYYKIYSAVNDMAKRFPEVGEALVLADGFVPLAELRVISGVSKLTS
jgi:hypothetical protein